MGSRIMFVAIAFGFVFCFVAAQDNKQEKAAWEMNRQILEAYFASPSIENAKRVLSVLPDRIDVEDNDLEGLHRAMRVIYEEHIADLQRFVSKGDRFALRIAFKAEQLADGAFAESLDSVIGSSIKVAPITFLEEAVPFVKKQSEWFATLPPSKYNGIRWFIDGILTNVGFEEPLDVTRKEIKLRIEALTTVKRQDLLELRDICLDILKTVLNEIKDIRNIKDGDNDQSTENHCYRCDLDSTRRSLDARFARVSSKIPGEIPASIRNRENWGWGEFVDEDITYVRHSCSFL
jgi:hypothetical protein